MTTNSDTDELPSELLDAFSRHIVSLSWLDASIDTDGLADDPDDYDPKAFSITAFVISVRDIWFLVTAGHILRDIDTRLKAGRTIVNSRLIDGLSSQESFPPIPFMLGDTLQWYIFENGLDYALIPLPPIIARQLIAGGVSALTEPAWTDMADSVDGYFLLGFPNQGADITVTSNGAKGNVQVRLGAPLLPIQRVDDPPDVLKCDTGRFYARVPKSAGNVDGKSIKLTDIKGMSGGPIFAVKRTDTNRSRYWLVAVQSGWAPKSRVLAACPIQPLVDAIGTCIDAHDDELKGHELDADDVEYRA